MEQRVVYKPTAYQAYMQQNLLFYVNELFNKISVSLELKFMCTRCLFLFD
jgi:hypothetical protein